MDYEKDFEEGRIKTSLGSLYYRHHKGGGERLVLLHGFGASTRSFARLVGFLDEKLDVYLVDLLGHGKSDAPEITYTVKAQADALWEMFEAISVSDFFLFGNSYGGWIAAYYATQYPVKGLILEDAAGLKESFDRIVADGKVQEYKDRLMKSAMMMEGNHETVLRSILDSEFREFELTKERFGDITEPTLILWGEKDQTLPPEIGRLMSERIRNSVFYIIGGGGHTLHYTNPKEVAGQIEAFVDR